MKKQILILLLALASVASQAATLSYTSGSGSNNVVITNPVLIRSITYANTSGNTVTNRTYDSNTNSLTWTNAPVSYVTQYVSNKVDTITNFSGVVQSTTNSYIFSVSATTGGSTNNFTLLTTQTLLTGTTVVFTPPSTLILNKGLMVTNGSALSITVDYSTIIP